MKSQGSNIYFASDFHLNSFADRAKPHQREKKIVRWLDSIIDDCAELYLLGDIFDFWFEYKHVVPKGGIRLLGKLAEFGDRGIPIHIFTGNHDLWMFGYFTDEFGAIIHKKAIIKEWNGKRFMIGHGDGLGPGDHGYKLIKSIFTNQLAQRLFAFLHPFIGVSLATFFSKTSRESTGHKDQIFLGDKEYLIQYIKMIQQNEHFDFFIFGHRHLVIDENVEGARYVNLGEWFSTCNYAKFDGNDLHLHAFES